MSMIEVQSNCKFDSESHVLHYENRTLPVDYTHFGHVQAIHEQPLRNALKNMAKAMGITRLGYPVVMLQSLGGVTIDQFNSIDAELPSDSEYNFSNGVLYYSRPGGKTYKVREYWAVDRTRLVIVK